MLVFSKTMKDKKVFKELVKQFKNIPSPIKDQMIAFARRNSYKVWKDYLVLLYKKYSKKEPKHLGKYLKDLLWRIKKIERKSRQFGKKKIKRKSKMIKKVPESLKKKCRKLKVRLTVKRGKKRVYKSEKVLKKQCKTAMKKKKKVVKRKRKFGRPSRHGGIIVPQMSNGFGRPYFGYTVGGKVRFGSRRPEFHYPEHVLKGYNTAKTNKKFRFGRPHRHPLRYASYNPSKTGKKFRFGKSKKIKENRFRNFKKDPLTDEEFEFIKKFNSKINTKKKAIKYSLVFAKIGKRNLNTGKPLLTDEDKEYLIASGNSKLEINLHNWCGLNPVKCAAAGIGTAGLVGGALIGAAKYHDSYNDSNDDSKYLKRAMTQRTRNAASDYFSKHRSSNLDVPNIEVPI